ncbi:penicillin-binding protein 1C [Pseudomaricurvus alkylphenolicus]|uniref:penicillin-binding protein 1C n=1 Tax=Pseudomaricurvus alkylphenolicus TaxID=1306991 RepID=UPI00141D8E04|nr:penicillin-binding protein 1C [Pseudomaricurvus alkylphenolicus]
MKSTLHKAGIVVGIVMALALVGAAVLIVRPLPTTLHSASYSKVLYSKEGVLLAATIAEDEQWRFPPVRELPDKYVQALLTYEDKRFYVHPGLDPLALARAVVANLKAGRVVSGGSTLTMQLARMLSGNRARTYTQKVREVALALQLEWHYSKEELLLLYATHAPYGGNQVGLPAATWRYYGRDMSSMTWAEAALFALLPNRPSSLNPGKNRDTLRHKRNRLLDKLHLQGHLDSLDLKLAKLEPLPEAPRRLPDRARHLLSTLMTQHPDKHQFRSTIDAGLQQQANDLAHHHSERLGKTGVNNLSILMIDNRHHQVLAYVGNKTYRRNPLYSPALDIVQRPRSSGSVFKPFLFSMMLQQGQLLPDSLVLDVPSFYDGYSPENYDRGYRGAVTARQALIESLNVPAVRLLQQYGVSVFKQDLETLGITTLFRPADEYGLSLILGGAETTLWDITNAYAGLAASADGRVDSFRQASLLIGETLVDGSTATLEFPVRQGAAWQTLMALTDVKRPGVQAAWQDFDSSRKLAWKTGTSYGWHDAWAIGSNGRYTIGVWAGNANGEEAMELTGSKAAAPIMLDLFRLLPDVDWPQKPHHALQEITVCTADGHLPAGGCPTTQVHAPSEAVYTRISPYHQRIHLDPDMYWRVHGACQPVSAIKTVSRFVLPPVAEFHYRRIHPGHQLLPPWRQDCHEKLPLIAQDLPMQLEYPAEGARIKIPVEINGELGRTIFKAQHRLSNAALFWHLDNEYLGSTRHIHEKAIAVNPGWHQLSLVDEQGYRLERWFRVM